MRFGLLLLNLKKQRNRSSKQNNLTCILTNKNHVVNNNNNNNSSSKRNYSSESSKASAMDVDAGLGESVKSQMRQVLDAGLTSVTPSVLIKSKVRYDGTDLLVDDQPYALGQSLYMVGFGKAVAGMACVLVSLLGDRLKRSIVSVPEFTASRFGQDPGTTRDLKRFPEAREQEVQQLMTLRRSSAVEYCEGARDNQPDDASLASTKRIARLAQSLGKGDTLIALVSGGGSALLFAPKPPMKPAEKRELCRRLQNSGASIRELNVVRKQVSMVKGGGLAKMAYPATVIALVLSDVVGDPLDTIASGPTVPLPPGNRVQSIEILKKYNLYHTLSDEVRRELFEKVLCDDPSLVAGGKFTFVENVIIGNNQRALEASAEETKKLDIEGVIMSNSVEGDVKDVSAAYALLTKTVCQALENDFPTKEDFIAEMSKLDVGVLNLTPQTLEKAYESFMALRKGKGLLLLAGGEPTVKVEGDGKGGRNQELALLFSLDWLSQLAQSPELSGYFVQFLSTATDGQDGPTDAAGAFGNPEIRPKMTKIMQNLKEEKKKTTSTEKARKIDNKINEITSMLPENVLKRNDSYTFFSKFDKGKSHVKTGYTGTNVMDLNYLYIKKRDSECDFPGIIKSDVPLDVNDFLFDDESNSEGCEKDN